MEQDKLETIVAAVEGHEGASWAVADALIDGVGRVSRPDAFDEVERELRRRGHDLRAATLKAYHQTAFAFPPGERLDACFSAHETARSNKRALAEAIAVYGRGPTVEQVRRVKANLRDGLAPDFVLPDRPELERQARQAWEAYDAAVAAGADEAERARLRDEAGRADELLRAADRTEAQADDRRARGDLKKVREACWLARGLARRARGPERSALAKSFRDLADLFDAEPAGDEEVA